jgi:hypothetical protein
MIRMHALRDAMVGIAIICAIAVCFSVAVAIVERC